MIKIFKNLWIVKVLTSKRFIKRLKAFVWHSGAMATVGSLDLILQELISYDADNLFVIILGLLIAQVTKELNKK